MYVKSLKLDKVKGFDTLDFNFQRPDGSFAGWTVLVGGNASGKTTILKCIALAVMGPDAGRQLLGVPTGWIQEGASRASATVTVVRDPNEDTFILGRPTEQFAAEVRWQSEKQDVVPVFRAAPLPKNKRSGPSQRGPWNPQTLGWFCVGYGPMRRLTGSSSESMRYSVGGIESCFVTLFREDAALSESEVWLKTNYSRSLENPQNGELKTLIASVSDLLGDGLLPLGMKVSKLSVDHVYVRDSSDVELPMRDISDGCRSIYATVLDIIHNMYEIYDPKDLFEKTPEGRTIVKKPGVVLIDEIDAHLHPAWQRDIPEWFKKHFPFVQLFVTTHSPLVTQAADENGVFWLPSYADSSEQARALDAGEIERLRLGRAEKTLLGTAFGLNSSRSLWANKRIESWKRLNAKAKAGVALSAAEAKDLRALKQQMDIAFDPVIEG